MNARLLALVLILALPSSPTPADDGADASKSGKKVLVELFTSQGCNSCPSANDLLGQLAKLGYGHDQIVPISFHVDYFNTPWVDPFSSKEFSRREQAYNSVLKRNDLYFTPMMMVDGRSPMLGSNRPEALKAIKRSLAEKPGTSIKLGLSGTGPDRALKVTVTPIAPEVAGRSVMVGMALTEGPITTRVPSGENAGSALVEPFVVRSFAFQRAKLESSGPGEFTFPVKLSGDSVEANTRVAVFVQDWDDGRVYQAESLPILAPKALRR